MKKKLLFDNLWLGFGIGLMLPLIAFILYYLSKYSSVKFASFLYTLHNYKLLFKIISLCVLVDLPIFYAFLQFKRYHSARGLVMACFIFAFAVLGYRIFN
jgi:hypothetical protein